MRRWSERGEGNESSVGTDGWPITVFVRWLFVFVFADQDGLPGLPVVTEDLDAARFPGCVGHVATVSR